MYRDGLTGLTNQILEKRAALASLEREISPLLRSLLPAHVRETIDDVPLIFTTRMVFPNESGRPTFIEMILPGSANGFASALRTSIPEAIPFFGAQNHGLWVTGAESSMALLTDSVRGALITMVEQRPVLRVGHGLVDLAWSGPWTNDIGSRAIPKAAIDTVVGLRQAVAFA